MRWWCALGGCLLAVALGGCQRGPVELPDPAPRAFDLQVGRPGASPWLGGLDIDTFGGNLVDAARSFGADAISPVHGSPQDDSILDPGYRPYVTRAMVDAAHAAGLRVIPWTVDDVATMNALIDARVDGLITNYPDRLRAVLASRGMPLPRSFPGPG